MTINKYRTELHQSLTNKKRNAYDDWGRITTEWWSSYFFNFKTIGAGDDCDLRTNKLLPLKSNRKVNSYYALDRYQQIS
jgi:hypothetical protein